MTCRETLTRALTGISGPGKLRVALVEIAGYVRAVCVGGAANKVEIEVSAIGVDLEDLETGKRGPRGLCTGVGLAIVAVHLGLVSLGGCHSLAGVAFESGVWGWGWLGNDVARVRRACEGASAGVDRWRGELELGDVVLGVAAIQVVVVVVITVVVGVRLVINLLVLVLVLVVVLLAIMRCDLRGSQRRRTGWLTERGRVPEPTIASPAVLMRIRLAEVVGRTRPSKDVLVRRVSRLWRGWCLCSGTHTTSRVHLSGRCGLRRGRAEVWVGGAQPGTGPSLAGDGRRRGRRRGPRPARRTISDKLPGLLAFQPTTLDAPLHDDRSAKPRRRGASGLRLSEGFPKSLNQK